MQSRKIHNACSLSIAQGEKQWCRPAIAKVRYPQREITNQGPRVRVRVEGLGTYKITDIYFVISLSLLFPFGDSGPWG